MNELPVEILSAGAHTLGLVLSAEQVRQFRVYADMLREWNGKVNLTAITAPQQIVEKHFLDSLSVLTVLPKEAFSLADIGSGAGFPGLALAIARPDCTVTLIEATTKKAAFLNAVVESLKLQKVSVVVGRAETLAHEPKLRERFDVATARAVANLVTLVELTLPFVRVGGRVIAQKMLGSESLESALPAIEVLGGTYEQELAVLLPTLADRRLIVISKRKPTPAEYPRRPGIPAKKPLLA